VGEVVSASRYDRLAVKLGLMRVQTILRYWRWTEVVSRSRGLAFDSRAAA
jgi:hypothetical protein